MAINDDSEKRFESDIETFLLSPAGGYTTNGTPYDAKLGLYPAALVDFIKRTQPKSWKRFELQNAMDAERRFCIAFSNACERDGILSVLRHGFKHKGIPFRVCYFKPESKLNQTSLELYRQNVITCNRQWYYSTENNNSVDMVLAINGIPVFAFELKNQCKGQSVEDSKRQWMYDRDPREVCFQFNRRVLAFFSVDLTEAWMATKLNGKNTYFLPFNQGSAGAGEDGGKGNPPNPGGYATAYLWENVFRKESMLDIVQKFINLETKEEKERQADGTFTTVTKTKLIFPRYHQLDVVRKLVTDVSANGVGNNYLIQHSAGSGKSNSIAWVAYRLASLFDVEDKPVFRSVIVVTDRTVLDRQLQDTISGFDHTLGSVVTINDKENENKHKGSRALLDAIDDGARIIVTTLQKFPVIYQAVEKEPGRNFAVIVDEAHSSQTGTASLKLKAALADTTDALKEYAEIEGKAEEEIDPQDKLVSDLIKQGKHKNLSFFAFTATPKPATLEMFGIRRSDGSFHPFHIYSMRQAIDEEFILDVLQNYMTYDTCYKIAKTIPDNPDVPASRTAKIIRKFQQLHPYNIAQKSQIIVETFMGTTRNAINGLGKMMVVTSSRLAAVRYFHEIKRYIAEHHYDIDVLVAFSGSVSDGGEDYTESGLNVRKDGTAISEAQTKEEFRYNFDVLVVAEKYQTGFDEPLLHTMIVDKKLKSVKAVQTLSRLNRTCPEKSDTFVLDFVNTSEEMQEAFQPFYKETSLAQEIDTDGIYKIQKELRGYGLYSDNDIKAFAAEYFKQGQQDSKALGRMTAALQPVAQRYNNLDPDGRYKFRRLLRSMVKWYGYIAQVVRMYDADMHREYTFCSYLLKLIPAEKVEMLDLEGKLKLEYYKLKETFKGQIQLDPTKSGEYEHITGRGEGSPEPQEPLDEIIKKINEKYKGIFTEGDRVLLSSLRDRLLADKKLKKIIQTTEPQIFTESIFPKFFGEAAQASYMESSETYKTLFADAAKYNAIMYALGRVLYRDLRK